MTEDDITDRLADEVAARICASHPAACGTFLRRLVALYTAQMVGRASAPGRISDRELGEWLGASPQRISEERARGLARCWKAYHERFPELLDLP